MKIVIDIGVIIGGIFFIFYMMRKRRKGKKDKA